MSLIPRVTDNGHPGVDCDRERFRPEMQEFAMFSAPKCPPLNLAAAMPSVDSEIRDFLAGRSDGEKLLHAIYDCVLDEPVPERLLAALKG